jgi:hypothetical protein
VSRDGNSVGSEEVDCIPDRADDRRFRGIRADVDDRQAVPRSVVVAVASLGPVAVLARDVGVTTRDVHRRGGEHPFCRGARTGDQRPSGIRDVDRGQRACEIGGRVRVGAGHGHRRRTRERRRIRHRSNAAPGLVSTSADAAEATSSPSLRVIVVVRMSRPFVSPAVSLNALVLSVRANARRTSHWAQIATRGAASPGGRPPSPVRLSLSPVGWRRRPRCVRSIRGLRGRRPRPV